MKKILILLLLIPVCAVARNNKLASYSARSISVANPEVYIQADIMSFRYIKKYFPRVMKYFTLEALPDIKTDKSIRFLPPTATLLRVDKNGKIKEQTEMSPLEKASLSYFLHKDAGKKNLFIYYCSDGQALVTFDGATQNASSLSCKPVLKMNEDSSTWLAAAPRSPKLSVAERNRAVLFASRLGAGTDQELLAKWRQAFGNYDPRYESGIGRAHLGLSHLLLQAANIDGGDLSPVAADIANPKDCNKAFYKCMNDNYRKIFAWNLLWKWGFASLSIDDSFASGGGGVCAEQSVYTASILNKAGVDYYAFHFTGYDGSGSKKDHRVIYVPKWNVTFSNNRIFRGFGEPHGYAGLVYVYHRGGWVFFAGNDIMGNLSREEAERFLADVFNKNFFKDVQCAPFTNYADQTGTCPNVLSAIRAGNYLPVF